ncbi:unnamed protein product [Spirodela intermedia]|nr:unnamed protein product [Spirodela intermedia]CAA6656456.1 unnamed protein product [Spirodela intermedia]
MAVVMGILFSAFVLGLLLMAAARFLLRRLCRTPPEGHPGKAVTAAVSSSGAGGPPTVYAAGETELVGSAAVCAICLSEFADGDAVRVLPPCRHGFHAECVEGWWASSSSAATALSKPLHRNAPPCCPVCRAIICQSSPAPETEHGTRPRS